MKAVKVLAAAVAAALAAEGACRGLERLERLGAVASPGFELYAVGESTAAGVPYAPEITPAKLVSRILGGRVRGRPIVPIDVARQGESIYPQAEEFESALRRRAFPGGPGAVFVYAGHNDAFDAEQTPFFEYFKEDVLFRSELLKALFFYAEKYRLIPRVRTMQTYEFNLRRVIESSRRAGLTPILATAASNFSGIDPGFPADSAAPGDV
ncbi:MAG TPA: hypothetical protein VH309_13640, partial [Elusimicrobiota bacterium]|nr:hypothetical protein [Elusimicrobiota bacterium]